MWSVGRLLQRKGRADGLICRMWDRLMCGSEDRLKCRMEGRLLCERESMLVCRRVVRQMSRSDGRLRPG